MQPRRNDRAGRPAASAAAPSWSDADTLATIPQHFARQAARRPDQPAIAAPQRTLTYAELDDLATRYVALLRTIATPGDRVALLLDHDADLVASALAALRLACTVVVLNPGDPPARLARILANAETAVLLANESHGPLARHMKLPDLCVKLLSSAPEKGLAKLDQCPPGPDDLAFLVSTSGSTGEPKLVMQTHRGMLHQVLRYTNSLEIDDRDRVSWLLPLSGGRGLGATWSTLLNGAILCPFPTSALGVMGLARWIEEQRVTVFDTLPSILRGLTQTLRPDQRIGCVRLVRLASEPAYKIDFEAYRRHFSPDSVLVHGLASTEAGMIAFARIPPASTVPDGPLPVGGVAGGLVLKVLDEDSRPVPSGEVGEIVVRAEPLAQGYWRDHQLTNQRFRTIDGQRWLFTGDLAKWAADGSLTVLGRADTQVKIRGFRLHLEEVEGALAAHPDVSGSAVTVRTTERGDTKLTAYVCGAPGRTLEVSELRRSLQAVLPPQAVPVQFVVVESLPLSANGKIDRGRLPEPTPAAGRELDDRSFSSETDEILAALWLEALELIHIDPHATFLDLGGDSLTAAVISTGVHDVFGVELDLNVFAADPTIAGLAAEVGKRLAGPGESGLEPLLRAPRTGPLSYAQARFWPQRPAVGPDIRWNVVVPFRIRGPLDIPVLHESINLVIERHEILHTSYVDWGGTPLAVVRPAEPLKLPVHDLRTDPDPAARFAEIAEREQRTPFDLEHGPLLRLRLFRLGEEHYWLLRTSHHIVHDAAASWRVFFDELALAYEALLSRGPQPFSSEPVLQYLDYAAWERGSRGSRTPRHRAEVDWWEQELQVPPGVVELPFTRSAPADAESSSEDVIGWGLTSDQSAALDRVARESRATYYMSRLAVFAALIAIETGSDDLVIGTPLSNRTRAEVQNMIGPFINFRMLRLRFHGDPSLHDWLAQVRRTVIDVVSHAALPWEQLMDELRSRGLRLPSVTARFIAWSAVPPMRFGGLELETLPMRYGDSWGFRLGVNRHYETNRCWAELDPAVYDPHLVRAFLSRLRALIAASCTQPHRSLRELHHDLPHE